jgi:hypothetical protein
MYHIYTCSYCFLRLQRHRLTGEYWLTANRFHKMWERGVKKKRDSKTQKSKSGKLKKPSQKGWGGSGEAKRRMGCLDGGGRGGGERGTWREASQKTPACSSVFGRRKLSIQYGDVKHVRKSSKTLFLLTKFCQHFLLLLLLLIFELKKESRIREIIGGGGGESNKLKNCVF